MPASVKRPRKQRRKKSQSKGVAKRPRRASCSDEGNVVYCISNADDSFTYVGVTNDMERRLAQHNGEKTGGARYTHRIKGQTGRKWRLLFLVTGLPTRKSVLQLEWRLHQRSLGVAIAVDSRKNPFGTSATGRRAWQLFHAFQRDRFTSTAPATSSLSPTIYWRDEALYTNATHHCPRPWPSGVSHVNAGREKPQN